MNTAESTLMLHPLIHRYLELKQALGRGYQTERYVLEGLDRVLGPPHAMDLTAETFALWCQTQYHLKPGVRRDRSSSCKSGFGVGDACESLVSQPDG